MEQMLTKPTFQKYSEYKDSGVDWLGKLPESWSLLSNKHIFKLKKNLVGKRSSEYTLLSLTLNGIIVRNLEDGGKFPAEFDTYQEVKKDDFVFCLFDVEETPRCVGLSEHQGMITGAYTVLECNSNFENRFLYYFYLNLDSDKRMSPLYTGLRNTISKDNFFAFKTFVPPFPEQTAIANFLDEKTTKIDQAIAQKEKMIALLKERKQIIIQNAVTKGLNPNVNMKDSGVEWIGEIPEHWEVERSQWLFRERKERAREKDEQLTSSQKFGVLSQAEYMRIEERRVTQVEFNREIQKHVEIGDFMISMRSFQGGIEYSPCEGCISSAYVPLIPSDKIESTYYKLLFKSHGYIKALQSTSNLVRDGQALRFENFKKVPLLVIPISEQKRIGNFMHKQIKRTDENISLQQTQIKKLKEYKATLIDSAVKGKIKVY